MRKPIENPVLDIYKNKFTLQWIVLIVSIVIGGASILYTNILVGQLKQREQRLIDLYAKSLEYAGSESNTANVSFIVQEIIIPNNSIPVVVTDELGIPQDSKNVKSVENARNDRDRQRILTEEIRVMEKIYEPILITLRDDNDQVLGFNYVYYKNSDLLTQLQFYPYVQLSIIAIFGLIAYVVFNFSKTAEQNRVWVGLAKETAHQLGTPLSSLMAWVEYFKTNEKLKDEEIVQELDKDIQRLQMITSRFSSIGSVPHLKDENIYEAISDTIAYLQRRISSKVKIEISSFPNDQITAGINKPLFDWVIENLCKNAVDAMGGTGSIVIKILKANEGKVSIDISDTGKGMPKSRIQRVFQPGFTTKKRGWGLGLTLVKRIIENYHGGRIFVKASELDKGTTFRIVLKPHGKEVYR
ncbi:MAG: HAMP domain-containing sensor histidine kinase [Bacteroidetes bacterium]|nr:HAMP domain-containing sensor histidine kinase [Bacteroidota bacterium]MDA1120563.1 HAMP domain-containing sensor histidine kinase [Bacteroidota bacterium]